MTNKHEEMLSFLISDVRARLALDGMKTLLESFDGERFQIDPDVASHTAIAITPNRYCPIRWLTPKLLGEAWQSSSDPDEKLHDLVMFLRERMREDETLDGVGYAVPAA
ncbi:MAG: hypothetical protein O3C21_10925 [Verrucomicrobia bacterium]|nr:hypothetical protein [Verrucomicrobiota bacterium]